MSRRFPIWCLMLAGLVALAGCTMMRPGSPATVKVCGPEEVDAAIVAAKGKVVLIDCWATWCGPCVASFPKLVDKHNKYADQGLVVISLSLDKPDDAPKVLAFLQRSHATFTNFHMPQDAAARKWLEKRLEHEGSIPHAALFDKRGSIVWSGHPLDDRLPRRIETELSK